jgi:hypothetical protein
LGWSEAELHQVRNHLWQGEAARRIWWDRTARSSLSEGGRRLPDSCCRLTFASLTAAIT